ncbi:MAG: hypothetical protein NDF57_07810 [archaeon GBS-70-058]|nr:hypothetical protein [Candidatus Culexarchaeum nevadense]
MSRISKPKMLILLIAKYSFYLLGWFWTLKPRRVESMEDVLNLFYIQFLRLKKDDIEVIKLNDRELITRAKNPCPILKLSLILKIDTKISCKIISEPVCKYVLRKLNPNLKFERNYNHIRPYSESCEERIYLQK